MKQLVRSIALALVPRRLYFAGSKKMCPLCKRGLRKFLPSDAGKARPSVLWEKNVTGGGYKPERYCPFCFCQDRERLVTLYLQNCTNLFKDPLKMLHIAPEKNLEQLIRQHDNIDYLTADLYAEGVMVKLDVTNIQYEDNSFDCIVCNHVMEHIPDDRKAMAEVFRVLRPGGWTILQTPISLSQTETFEDPSVTDPDEREHVFGQHDHVRIYARDYLDRMRSVGFTVEEFNWVDDPAQFGGEDNIYGLEREETLFFFTKPA